MPAPHDLQELRETCASCRYSTVVTVSQWVAVSIPTPPSHVSSPGPPSRMSCPPPPQSSSLPGPPRSVSWPAPPQSTSLPPPPAEQVVPALPMDHVIPGGADQLVSLGRAHQRGRASVADDLGHELHRTNVAVAFLGAQHAALILAQRLALGVTAVLAPGITGRTIRHQGMGLGGATVIGQGRSEDVCQLNPCWGDNIRGAGTEARDSSGTVHAKEVVVVGTDSTSNLRPGRGGIA